MKKMLFGIAIILFGIALVCTLQPIGMLIGLLTAFVALLWVGFECYREDYEALVAKAREESMADTSSEDGKP